MLIKQLNIHSIAKHPCYHESHLPHVFQMPYPVVMIGNSPSYLSVKHQILDMLHNGMTRLVHIVALSFVIHRSFELGTMGLPVHHQRVAFDIHGHPSEKTHNDTRYLDMCGFNLDTTSLDRRPNAISNPS